MNCGIGVTQSHRTFYLAMKVFEALLDFDLEISPDLKGITAYLKDWATDLEPECPGSDSILAVIQTLEKAA